MDHPMDQQTGAPSDIDQALLPPIEAVERVFEPLSELKIVPPSPGITEEAPDPEIVSPFEAFLEAPDPTEAPVEELSWRARAHQKLRNSRVWDIAKTFGRETKGKDRKLVAAGVGVLVVGSQVVDRLRSVVVIIPPIVTETLKHTHSPEKAAMIGAAIFAAWSFVVGELFHRGVATFPDTKDAVNNNFPGMGEFLSSLPGYKKPVAETAEPATEEIVPTGLTAGEVIAVDELSSEAIPVDGVVELEVPHVSRVRKVGRVAAAVAPTSPRRGMTVVGLGSTGYVGVSALDGTPTKEISLFNTKIAIESGLVVFGVVDLICRAITELPKHGQEKLAFHIQNFASDSRSWLAIAGTLFAADYIPKKLKQHKERKETLEINEAKA